LRHRRRAYVIRCLETIQGLAHALQAANARP
jgi:hypothetical protein